jgi:rfaE bifunctional protein nucleotidyltransferase chain/domain
MEKPPFTTCIPLRLVSVRCSPDLTRLEVAGSQHVGRLSEGHRHAARALSLGGAARYDGAMTEKVLSEERLLSELARARAQGRRIVFTNGCFDLLHVGHTRYLQAAKSLGDLLVVGVNTDASVRSLEKAPDRPIVPESQRAEVLAALSCVDFVVLFADPDPGRLIAAIQPDVLEARGGVVRTIPLVPGMSTTAIIQRIRSTPA